MKAIPKRGRRLKPMTLSQAERMNARLAEMMQLDGDVLGFVRTGWVKKYLRRTCIPFQWAWAYELSVGELICVVAALTDSVDELRTAVSDDYDAVLALPDVVDEQPVGRKPKRRTVLVAIALLCALVHSLRAIGYHGLSMDELIGEALRGDVLALRRAVAIDPTVLAAPSVAAFVTDLHVRGEAIQLQQLYRAAAKGPNKQLMPNRQLRYFERVLREGQVFETYSREDVYRLIVEKTRLYGSSGDAFKGLFTLLGRWQEDATT